MGLVVIGFELVVPTKACCQRYFLGHSRHESRLDSEETAKNHRDGCFRAADGSEIVRKVVGKDRVPGMKTGKSGL
ncbi:hypothetical protein [Marvinbryantia formatexigens]|uniref:hypothetical protein n=1 Tax=Marvinbryantia formatexigens TaxID=168384 RepID=UPI001A9A5783|nr:hypothetical protein [Marvinbryantia formatexigens]